MILGADQGTATTPCISDGLMSAAPVAQGSTICFGSLQSDGRLGLGLNGDVFPEAALAVFDVDNQRFEYAARAGIGGVVGDLTTFPPALAGNGKAVNIGT